MAAVALLGTLDTKGREYAFLRDRVREQGVDVVLIDVGILGEPLVAPDVSRDEVASAADTDIASLAAAAGTEIRTLVEGDDRGAAIEAMSRGAAEVVLRLHGEGRIDGVLGLGGSGNSTIVSHAMRALPIGVPKLLVSTVASGDTRPYIGAVDIAMMYSVVDIAGINRISARIMTNAATMIAGAVKARVPDAGAERPLVGASMFGVTTASVTVARERLEELGYEVLVFHATGAGGQSMEALARAGFLAGVLDATTTELADELVGGVLSAGPERLEAAGAHGVPQVVSLGALDMVNFGPRETVPDVFADRNLYVHNATVTLMRTTPVETLELGRQIGRKLSAATGPTVLFVPLKGVSAIAVHGQVFHDAEADAALLRGLDETLSPTIERHDIDTDINDPAFARAMADRLDELIKGRT